MDDEELHSDVDHTGAQSADEDSERRRRIAQIVQEIEDLTESPLYALRQENGYRPVIGAGNLHAALMFIGEAPGEREAQRGEPFAGASGRVLDELLASIGLERSTVYITNVVKDRPPKNRDPNDAEIALYKPFLVRQIEIIRPTVLAPLGRFAMNFVLELLAIQLDEPAKISALHGRALTGRAAYGPVQVVPLYHPAVALYNNSQKATLMADMQTLKQLID